LLNWSWAINWRHLISLSRLLIERRRHSSYVWLRSILDGIHGLLIGNWLLNILLRWILLWSPSWRSSSLTNSHIICFPFLLSRKPSRELLWISIWSSSYSRQFAIPYTIFHASSYSNKLGESQRTTSNHHLIELRLDSVDKQFSQFLLSKRWFDLRSQCPPSLSVLFEGLLVMLEHALQLSSVRRHVHVVFVVFYERVWQVLETSDPILIQT